MLGQNRQRIIRYTIPSLIAAVALNLAITTAQAEIDGHGPDAWRVQGVAATDTLKARMGPGTHFPVIETFPHNERGMQLITCVPYYTLAHYTAMTQAQIDALPPRWCLMRNAAMSKAGWVAQRFITPDDAVATPNASGPAGVSTGNNGTAEPADMIAAAQTMVRELYTAYDLAAQGRGSDPLTNGSAATYYTDDIVALLQSGQVGAHPLYGAQDFDGRVNRIAPDPDQAMLRGMVTIHVDFINFGQAQRATYLLRPDTTQAAAPLRIFRVEHEGWSFP